MIFTEPCLEKQNIKKTLSFTHDFCIFLLCKWIYLMDLDIITVYISGYCWKGGNQINMFVRKVFFFLYIMLEASRVKEWPHVKRRRQDTDLYPWTILFRIDDLRMSPPCGEQHFTHFSSSYIMRSLTFRTSQMSQSVLIHLPGQHMIHVVNTSVHILYKSITCRYFCFKLL